MKVAEKSSKKQKSRTNRIVSIFTNFEENIGGIEMGSTDTIGLRDDRPKVFLISPKPNSEFGRKFERSYREFGAVPFLEVHCHEAENLTQLQNGLENLLKENMSLISAEDLAVARIFGGINSTISRRGMFVTDYLVCSFNGNNLLVKSTYMPSHPVFGDISRLYYFKNKNIEIGAVPLSKEAVSELESKSIVSPDINQADTLKLMKESYEKIPVKRFQEYPITRFLFGKASQKYGEQLLLRTSDLGRRDVNKTIQFFPPSNHFIQNVKNKIDYFRKERSLHLDFAEVGGIALPLVINPSNIGWKAHITSYTICSMDESQLYDIWCCGIKVVPLETNKTHWHTRVVS